MDDVILLYGQFFYNDMLQKNKVTFWLVKLLQTVNQKIIWCHMD